MGAADKSRSKQKLAEDHRRRVENDEWQKVLAGAGGYALGVAGGVPRGAYDTVRDLSQGLNFATRLINPFDPFASPPGQSAWEQTGRAAAAGAQYVAGRALHPQAAVNDGRAGLQRFAQDINPAPGFAPTPMEQFRVGLRQGANAGEAAFDAATLLATGPELKTLRELGYLGKAPTVAERVAAGTPLNQARYFAELYDQRRGMGSHGFIPRRATLPGGRPVPQWLLDSEWNRTMPAPSATKGEMFGYHYSVDPKYQGGSVSKPYGGGGWSGKGLGWVKNGPLEQRWRGVPLRTKAAAYGALAGFGAIADPFLSPGEN
jgi:hypothetical protein